MLGHNLLKVEESPPIAFTLGDREYRGTSGLCFSADGKHLACAFTEGRQPGSWWVGDVAARRKLAHVSQPHQVYSTRFFRNETLLVGCDDKLQVWDYKKPRMVDELTSSLKTAYGVVAVAAAGDQSGFAFGDRNVMVWSAATKTAAPIEFEITDKVRDTPRYLEYSPDNRKLAVVLGAFRVLIVDAKSRKVELELRLARWIPKKCTFSPNGQFVATVGRSVGGKASDIQIWNVAERRIVTQAKAFPNLGRATGVQYTPDGRYLFVCGSDHPGQRTYFRAWNLSTGENIVAFRSGIEGDVVTFAISPDGKWIAAGEWDGKVVLFDVKGILNR